MQWLIRAPLLKFPGQRIWHVLIGMCKCRPVVWTKITDYCQTPATTLDGRGITYKYFYKLIMTNKNGLIPIDKTYVFSFFIKMPMECINTF